LARGTNVPGGIFGLASHLVSHTFCSFSRLILLLPSPPSSYPYSGVAVLGVILPEYFQILEASHRNVFFMNWDFQPHAQPQILFSGSPTTTLDMPASSYATAGVAVGII
jgi:hypothetical protein